MAADTNKLDGKELL